MTAGLCCGKVHGFGVRLHDIFAVIQHRFFLKSDWIPAKNLYNLTNKPAAQSNTNHYAV